MAPTARRPAVTADVTALPFRSGAFDVVVAAFVVNHLPDPTAGLTELRRVTRARRCGAGLDVLRRRAAAKGAVDGVAAAYGFVAPQWYGDLQECAHAVGDPASFERSLAEGRVRPMDRHRGAGRRGADRARRRGPLPARRCRTCTPFVNTLTADARRGARGRSGRSGAADRRTVRAGGRRGRRTPDLARQPGRGDRPERRRRARPPRGPRARPAASPWPARTPTRSRRRRRRPATSPRARPPRPGRRGRAASRGSSTRAPSRARAVARTSRASTAYRASPRSSAAAATGSAASSAAAASCSARASRARSSPRRWSNRHLLWNHRAPGLRLGDRQPVGGAGEVTGAEQAVGHVELALGQDLLAVGQLEPGARELLGRRGRRGCAASSCGRCAGGRRTARPVPRRSISRSSRSSTRSASALRPSSP